MRKLSRREQKIFIVCAVFVGVYGINNVVLKPFKINTNILGQQIKKGENRLKKNLKVVWKYKTVTEEYQEYVKDFKQKMRDEEQMSAIISQLESMTQKNQLQFSEMKPQKISRVDFYKVFPVSLKLDGSLEQVSQFLYALQSAPYYFQVDKLRLEKKSRQQSILKATLVLSKILIFEE